MAITGPRSGLDPLGSWGRSARGGVDRRPGPRVGALAPDQAIRARLNAALLDLVIVTTPTIAISMRAAGATYTAAHVLSAGRLALVLLVQVLFGAVCEAASGATIGKRVFGLRVVALEGAPATALQALVRNALRVIDALPLLYAAGLIAMARSGGTRRQRIGDLAAGTTVTLGDGGRPLRTPRWLLPSAVLVAAALSVAAIAISQ